MNNLQETLLFPVRDAESRKQFLIASAIMLAMFIIPILPIFLLMGYSARIMRQILEERKVPSMPAWQGSNWSDMLLDGLRLYGAQLVLMLPLFVFMGCGWIFMMSGSFSLSALADENTASFAPIGLVLMVIGIIFFMVFAVLSLPYGVIISAALPHVVAKNSFQAAFEFREWFAIFRKALGQFILGYALVTAGSFVVALVMQVAVMTLVLICIVPFLMVPYMVYQILVMNALFAQAYNVGRAELQTV